MQMSVRIVCPEGHPVAVADDKLGATAICPFCFSDKTELQQASGNGRIYTYSVMRRAPIPYAIAYVTLSEGPTMMTNIVDCDLDKIRIGQSVRLVFKPSDGGPPVPMFTPT